MYEFGDEKTNPMSTPLVPSFTTESAIYAEYLKQHRPNAKVAILYLNTDFGQNFLAGFKEAIKGSKITLTDAQPNNYSDPTVDSAADQSARERRRYTVVGDSAEAGSPERPARRRERLEAADHDYLRGVIARGSPAGRQPELCRA